MGFADGAGEMPASNVSVLYGEHGNEERIGADIVDLLPVYIPKMLANPAAARAGQRFLFTDLAGTGYSPQAGYEGRRYGEVGRFIEHEAPRALSIHSITMPGRNYAFLSDLANPNLVLAAGELGFSRIMIVDETLYADFPNLMGLEISVPGDEAAYQSFAHRMAPWYAQKITELASRPICEPTQKQLEAFEYYIVRGVIDPKLAAKYKLGEYVVESAFDPMPREVVSLFRNLRRFQGPNSVSYDDVVLSWAHNNMNPYRVFGTYGRRIQCPFNIEEEGYWENAPTSRRNYLPWLYENLP